MMLWSPLSRFSAKFVLWSLVGLIFTNIALAQAEESTPTAQDTTVTKAAQDQSNAFMNGVSQVGEAANQVFDGLTGSGLPPKFIADGAPIELSHIGLTITPPQGWEVLTSDPKLSLIMQEPQSDEIIYDTPLYRRNITVAKVASPSPIDEQRAKELKAELTEAFGKQGGVEDFQIIEHKFFDYKAKNDGLLVYTAFTMSEHKLMQMHVLISDAQRQFLMTYTDFADRFQDDILFQQAWSTIASAQVASEPPSRWTNLVVGSAVVGLLILALLLLVFIRHRRATSMYMHDADEVYRDDVPSTKIASRSDASWHGDRSNDNDFPVTQTGVWNLGTSSSDDDDWSDGSEATPANARSRSSRESKSRSNDGWNIHHRGEDSEEGLSFVTNFR